MAQDLVPQDQVPWRHTFSEEKKTTTEAGVCLQPGLLSSKLCQNGSTTVAHEGGRFFLPTCDPAFGGIAGGRGLDWEGGPRHVLSSIFDDDVIDTQVLWCVGHIESSICIVLDVRTDEGAVWALWVDRKQTFEPSRSQCCEWAYYGLFKGRARNCTAV